MAKNARPWGYLAVHLEIQKAASAAASRYGVTMSELLLRMLTEYVASNPVPESCPDKEVDTRLQKVLSAIG